MSWLRYLRRKQRDQELAHDIETYLALEIEENIAAGMSPRAAALAAHRKFGNVAQIKETVRDMNTLGFLETVWQDLRYGARLLRLDPGFFVVASLSLALGVGANTAIFQLIDAVRLRTLPISHPEELAEVQLADTEHCCSGNFSDRHPNLTHAQWEQIEASQQGFSSIFAWGDHRFNLASGGEARYAEGLWVTGHFFDTLRVAPLLGRMISPDDDRKGCGTTNAVIGYSFWQREYGGDPKAIGKKLMLDGHPTEVIGVAPAHFYGVEVGRTFDVAVPVCAEPLIAGQENSHTAKRHHWWLAAIGRLKPGWTSARAKAQLEAASPAIFQATVPPNYTPEAVKYYLGYKLTAKPAGTGVSSLRQRYEDPLLILLAIAALVLLIACANLANLMLARASTREREIAVRLAIGASRPRLIRQLLAESLLLASAGAVAGALLAQALVRYLVSFLTTDQNRLFVDLGIDWRILSFTAALAVLTCILFGLTPAIRATGTTPGAAMKANSRGLTAGRERFTLRRALVVSQVALSLVLLVGALLFTRSLHNLLTLDAGFRSDGLLATFVDLSPLNYPPERRLAVFQQLLEHVRATPGVEFASTASIVPVSGDRWNDRIELPGTKNKDRMISNFARVSSGYFRTLGTPLLAGRDFDDHDTVSSPAVAVVNESFVRKFMKGASPMGQSLRVVTGPVERPQAYQIVGLTRDAKYVSLRDDFSPTVFVAQNQDPQPRSETTIITRSPSSVALTSLLSGLRKSAGEVSPQISLSFQPVETQIEESLTRERLMATLSGFFGFLAAALATIGLYGVMSYMVARRRSEIGIRIALGAGRDKILTLILGEAGALLGIGLLIGIVLSIATARVATAMLYGLQPHDPLTLALALFLLAGVALVASLLPARRAANLEPMTALREE